MDWQELSALVVVAVTTLMLIRHFIVRRTRPRTICGHSCVCPATEELRSGDDTLNVDPQNNILRHRFSQERTRTSSTAGPRT